MNRDEILSNFGPSAKCLVHLNTETVKDGIHIFENGLLGLVGVEPTYQDLVNLRLEQNGLKPDFVAGELAWGYREAGTPFICHNDKTYIQVTVLAKGKRTGFVGKGSLARGLSAASLASMYPDKTRFDAYGQGLPVDQAVIVKCYNIESIYAFAVVAQIADMAMLSDAVETITQ